MCELLACPDDVPVLENFAYGDTPSREALVQLLGELLAGAPGDELVVAEYDVSTRFDVRPLVLKTLLTYLELEGLLRQGTPFYAGYRMRPLGEQRVGRRLRRLRRRAPRLPRARRRGRQAGPRLDDARTRRRRRRARGGPRARRLRTRLPRGSGARRAATGRGAATLRRADHTPTTARRSRTSCSRASSAASALRSTRIQRVLELVTADTCQVQALVAYFGEERAEPCGHCSHCLSGRAELPPASPLPSCASIVAPGQLAALRSEHAFALGEPRQLARFLCGLSSPATTRTKLTRHELYGALAAHRFADVLALCTDAA